MLMCKKFLIVLGLVGIGFLVGGGCPRTLPPPAYTPFFLVSPDSLDFGTDQTSLPLYVAKSYTALPLPTFTVASAGQVWITVSPPTGNSTGPNDVATFDVTVERSLLGPGTNMGSVVVSAPGISPKTVPVTATARIAADFSSDTQVVQVGNPVNFTDLSGVAPGENPISSWDWNFGDGQTSTMQNPTVVYAQKGVFTVTLTVSNGTLSDTETKVGYISVEGPEPPKAKFTVATTTPIANTPVQFTDLSDPGTSPITDWLWNFGDGEMSTDTDPVHVYHQVATFTVSLMVTTADGTDTKTKFAYIDVQPQPPTAEFEADDTTPAVGQTVHFTDLSDPGSATQIDTWFWDFGDGVTSIIQSPSHMYTAASSYSVYLGVTTVVGGDSELKVNYINVHSKKFLSEMGAASR